MEQSLTLVLLYALLPACSMVVGGGLVATHYLLRHKARSAIQHFAAGSVFAAVSLEILPRVVGNDTPWQMVLGFLLGLAIMFAVKALTEYLRSVGQNASTAYSPVATFSGISIDLFVDGLLISIAFLAGVQGGILITLALAIEELFLGMSMSQLLGDRKITYPKQMFIIAIFALLVLLGAWAGFSSMHALSPALNPFILSLGMSALLYLVTEELLTDMHAKLETPWITATFFLGFLFILIVETVWW